MNNQDRKPAGTRRGRPQRPDGERSNKRALFVRVKLPNDQFAFLDVTRNIGGALPFEKPVATCAMEVSRNVVAFSLIHLNRHSTEVMKERDLGFPVGAVARLIRKGNSYKNLSDNEMVVVAENLEPEVIPIERTPEGKVAIPELGSQFELTKRPSRVDMFMRSPGTGRILAVGFGGHFGSDGSKETVGRAAGKVLRSLSGLGAWKALSGISAVELPRMAETQTYAGISIPDNLNRAIKVSIWDDDGVEMLADGEVTVELDMTNADHATEKFLFHIKPDSNLAERWNGDYTEVTRVALDRHFDRTLGSEGASMVYAIVLGEITDTQMKTLEQVLWTVPGLDITPTRWRVKPTTHG